MGKGTFITGTDTGIGKTVITGLLARLLHDKGRKVVTQKWVQTGCYCESEDIQQHYSIAPGIKQNFFRYRDEIAPYVFEKACSPHFASRIEKKNIDPEHIKKAFLKLKENFDHVLVEGSGGLMVPLNTDVLLVDLVCDLDLDVLVVTGNRLGAINHTLLTLEALKTRGANVLGVLYNDLQGEDPLILKDNCDIIATISGIRTLGGISYEPDMERAYEKFVRYAENILKVLEERKDNVRFNEKR